MDKLLILKGKGKDVYSVPVDKIDRMVQEDGCYTVIYFHDYVYSTIQSTWSAKKITRKVNRLKGKQKWNIT